MSESFDRLTSHPNERDTLLEILRTEHIHRRTAIPGTVIDFDSDCSTATIQVGIETDLNGSIEPIAPLLDVPVIFPMSGGRGIKWILEPGDDGLIVFSDRAIGRWLDEGSTVWPEDTRVKHLSDGSFIPGINRDCAGGGFNGTSVSNGDNVIEIGSNCFDINVNGCSLMDTLIQMATGLTPPQPQIVTDLTKIKGVCT